MSENIKQGDEFSWIHVLEKDDGEPVDLRMASAVYAVAILYGESVPTFNKECEIQNAENGYISLKLTSEDTATAGMYKLAFKCHFTDDDVMTVPSSNVLWLHIEESYTE